MLLPEIVTKKRRWTQKTIVNRELICYNHIV